MALEARTEIAGGLPDSKEQFAGPRFSFFLILLLIVLVHVPGLRDPLIGHHDMRMNESAAVARNFYEQSMSILYPRVDWGGSGPGYEEDGFQAYTFLVAMLYKLFGFSEILGRALNVFFFLASAIFLFLLAKRLFNPTVALWALFFYGVAPLGIYFGRSFQPDILILTSLLAGVYFFLIWIEDGGESPYWGSLLAILVAGLMKPVSLFIGLPLAYLTHRRFGWSWLRQTKMWLYAAVVFISVAAFYLHVAHLLETYGNSQYSWGWYKFASAEILLSPSFYVVMAKRLVMLMTTPIGFPFFLVGVFFRRPQSNYVLQMWILGFAVVAIVTAPIQKAHDYYQLPMLPPTALLTGAGVEYVFRRMSATSFLGGVWSRRALCLGICGAIALLSAFATHRYLDYVLPSEVSERLAFPQRLRELTEPGSLTIIGSKIRRGPGPATSACCRHREADGRYLGHEPIEFYQSHRKGWSLNPEDWSIDLVDTLRGRGAEYFATSYVEGMFEKPGFVAAMNASYTLLEGTSKWRIYRLEASSKVARQ